MYKNIHWLTKLFLKSKDLTGEVNLLIDSKGFSNLILLLDIIQFSGKGTNDFVKCKTKNIIFGWERAQNSVKSEKH